MTQTNKYSNSKFFIAIFFGAFLISSCSSAVRFADKSADDKSATIPGKVFYGKASYYADAFHGKTTANGEIFDMNKLTAAHRTFPFGTLLQVRNLKNNKTVIVRINDRGPFIENRIIDLSKAAAEALDMFKDGIIDVEILVLE